jgi:hypothetical protein
VISERIAGAVKNSASIRIQFWLFGNIMRSTSASDVTSGGPKSLFSKG